MTNVTGVPDRNPLPFRVQANTINRPADILEVEMTSKHRCFSVRFTRGLAAASLGAAVIGPIPAGAHDGAWRVLNPPAAMFASRAAGSGGLFVGDFNCDQRDDMVMIRPGHSVTVLSWHVSKSTWSQRSYGAYRNVSIPSRHGVVGDFNGDGCDDVAIGFRSDSQRMPVFYGKRDGGFTVHERGHNTLFGQLKAENGVVPLVGDFDGDRKSDIALVRNEDKNSQWGVLPVAFGTSHVKGFNVRTGAAIEFANLAKLRVAPSPSVARPHATDFDNDGRDEIALVNLIGRWNFLPVAHFSANGQWTLQRPSLPGEIFNELRDPSSRTGEFVGQIDDDGRADIMMFRKKIPESNYLMSMFGVSRDASGAWRTIRSTAGKNFGHNPRILSGDFDGDGKIEFFYQDGNSNGKSVVTIDPFTRQDGLFRVNHRYFGIGDFANWIGIGSPQIGDFNGDGLDDIALVRRSSGWNTVPVAFSLSHPTTN